MTAQRIPLTSPLVRCPIYGAYLVLSQCFGCEYYRGKDEDAESVLCAWEREG